MLSRKRRIAVSVVLFVVVLSCSLGTDDRDVEANDLGIANVEMHRLDGEDRVLVITATDEQGLLKARAQLRTGLVYIESDWAPPSWVYGTEVTIIVGEQQVRYATPGVERHEKPEPIRESLASFVRLRAVARAIDEEVGIRFKPHDGGEVAFFAANCSGANFSMYNVSGNTLGNPQQCCQDGNQWFKIGGGGNIGKLATRSLSPYGACKTSSGGSCTGTACTYGPCGAEAWGATGTVNAAVFTPRLSNFTNRCGWDDNGSEAGGNHYPEPYTDQQTKPGVTATCPYTWCVAGTATYGDKALTLTVFSGSGSGAGHVVADLPSYTLTGQIWSTAGGSGAQRTGYYFGGHTSGSPAAQTVKLTAYPNAAPWGSKPMVNWSGYCNFTASNGTMQSSCDVPMTQGRTQNVTFDNATCTRSVCSDGTCCEVQRTAGICDSNGAPCL